MSSQTLAAGGQQHPIFNELPAVRTSIGMGAYYVLFSEDGQSWGNPNVRMGLTIAGMWHVPYFRDSYAPGLVRAIEYVARRDRTLPPNPDGAVYLELTLDDLITAMGHSLAGWEPDRLAPLLRQEPPLWGAVHPDNTIRITSARWLPSFIDVSEPRDYLGRVVRSLGADQGPQPVAVLPSALALPEALGYLDAVWRAQTGTHLLGLIRPAAAAKLAARCNSADEFDGRLSALSDVLGQLNVQLPPDEEKPKAQEEKSLGRLRRNLAGRLEAEAFERVSAAVGDLQAAVRDPRGWPALGCDVGGGLVLRSSGG